MSWEQNLRQLCREWCGETPRPEETYTSEKERGRGGGREWGWGGGGGGWAGLEPGMSHKAGRDMAMFLLVPQL